LYIELLFSILYEMECGHNFVFEGDTRFSVGAGMKGIKAHY